MKKILPLLKRAINPKNWRTLCKELCTQHREIVMYIVFGVLTTVVSFGSYYLFRFIFPSTTLFGIKSATTLPVVLSWVCAVLFAYVTNRRFVFESRSHGFANVAREILSFTASRLATLFIDMLIMFLLVDLTGIHGVVYEFFARVADNVVVLTLNFVLSKLFVFRKT